MIKKDFLIYFAGKTIPAVVNLALIILALRWLGKETYGRYSLVFYFVMLVSTFSIGWIQQSVIRYLSAYQSRLRLAVVRFTILSVISSLAGAVIVVIAGLLYFSIPLTDCLVLALVLFLYNILVFKLSVDQSLFKPLRYALREGTYNICMLAVFVSLVVFIGKKDYMSIFLAMLAGLVLVLFFPTEGKQGAKQRPRWSMAYLDPSFTRKMWTFGLSISVWLSISYLFNIANRFLIKEYAGYEQVGVFSSIYDLLFKIAGFACMPVLLAYHPKVASLWNKGYRHESLKEIKRALAFEFLILLAVVSTFMLLRPFLFNKVLHLNEDGLAWMSFVLIISAFLWQAALLFHKALELMLKIPSMITAIIISLVINVAANIVLLPVYGYRASAYATFAGIVVYIGLVLLLTYYYLKKEGLHE